MCGIVTRPKSYGHFLKKIVDSCSYRMRLGLIFRETGPPVKNDNGPIADTPVLCLIEQLDSHSKAEQFYFCNFGGSSAVQSARVQQ